jgi:hypothetical protein
MRKEGGSYSSLLSRILLLTKVDGYVFVELESFDPRKCKSSGIAC